MKNQETGWTEPDIVINGKRLNFPEAMSLRVAVGTFLMMADDIAGVDGPNYKPHVQSVARMLVTHIGKLDDAYNRAPAIIANIKKTLEGAVGARLHAATSDQLRALLGVLETITGAAK